MLAHIVAMIVLAAFGALRCGVVLRRQWCAAQLVERA
jgi:hypothetical protein